tara:strand:+ start:21213 stop:23288 length:2076 start_codon:yes stop_codon:yes gene_type:complete
MAFQVSPGVNISEVDLSTTIPSVATSDAAMAFATQWGPADKITTVTGEKDLASQFGKPDTNTQTNWLTAASFLAYAGSLQIVRTIGSDAKNAMAGSGGTAPLIKNQEDFESATHNVAQSFVARYPGTLGNGLIVGLYQGSGTIVSEQILTFTSASPSGNWQASQDHASVTQTSTTGTGTGASFRVVSSGTSALTITLVASGKDYTVGDTITLTDPGSTSETVVLTVSTISASSPAFDSDTVLDGSGKTGTGIKWSDHFDEAPNSGSETQFAHVIVIDSLGNFGSVNEVIEKHAYVSLASNGKDEQGNSNYIVEVIKRESKYIWCTGKFDSNTQFEGVSNWDTGTTSTTFDSITEAGIDTGGTSDAGHWGATLAAGIDDNGTGSNEGNSTAKRQIGYELFDDPEQTDVSLFPIGVDPGQGTGNGNGGFELSDAVIVVAGTSRKDAVVFTSPAEGSVTGVDSNSSKASKVIADRAKITGNSYAVMDSGWKQMYNKYTDKFVNVPLNGDVAGLCVATDNNRDPWYSPAGFNRGQVKNVVKLHLDPNKSSRDTLYKKQVNPVATFPGEGPILFGDKTMQSKPSAFDRINVRRLFIVLEKSISAAAKYSLFEFNDEFTRANFRSMVDPFLREIKTRRGITDYLVVCDGTNNTSEVIDRNEFVGDIFIKPARSINYIQLNFVAVKTGVSFNEVVGQV